MVKIDPNQSTFEGFPVPVQLDTQEKLLALRDDPTAGFLPFSHAEKSRAFEMLDYLSNSRQYPAGLGNRLQEIYLHNLHQFGSAEARRAMFSIAYEYGDFALNAQTQHNALLDIVHELSEEHFKPGVMVAEDFPEEHRAMPAIVRFVDVLAVREQKSQLTVFDPLKVNEKRFAAPNNIDDKAHKKIGDRYTADDPIDEIEQRVSTFMETTSIAQLRPVAKQALANEERRLKFWTDRLRDTRRHGAAWIIGRQILPKLEPTAA